MSDHIRDRIAKIITEGAHRDYFGYGRTDQILREFAVLHRSEETIEDLEGGVLSCGSGRAACVIRDGADPRVLRNFAANAIALAEYMEGQEAKNNTRNKRRDELAAEFSGCGQSFGSVSKIAKKAIDRIIELEAAL